MESTRLWLYLCLSRTGSLKFYLKLSSLHTIAAVTLRFEAWGLLLLDYQDMAKYRLLNINVNKIKRFYILHMYTKLQWKTEPIRSPFKKTPIILCECNVRKTRISTAQSFTPISRVKVRTQPHLKWSHLKWDAPIKF